MPKQQRKGDSVAQAQGERLLLARQQKARKLDREVPQREIVEIVNQGEAGGLTLEAYGSYERGRHRIPQEWLVPIAKALDVTPWYIQGLPEPTPWKDKVRFICDQANQIENEQFLDFLVDVTSRQVEEDRRWSQHLARLRGGVADEPPPPEQQSPT